MIRRRKQSGPLGQVLRILWLAFFVAQFLVSGCASAQTPEREVTAEQAFAIVKEKLLKDQLEGKAVFVSASQVKGGDTIKAMIHEYRVPEGLDHVWIVFIDDAVEANWEHPCRYVFVNSVSGSFTVLNATAPPDDLDSYTKVYPKQ
jgi:hypothetical protein